jgi:arabinose-5-phosphate isomerase
VTLDCRVSEEACPMKLVPTASTTAMLALGDALAMTVLEEKGFQRDDFGICIRAASLASRSAESSAGCTRMTTSRPCGRRRRCAR